ncbi:related to isotrichodermin C-15 hydroxylase (cytochrome P-450 monooxygenase CYP65A1) [Ramularia collo-cygni]|uniref:Related to isotrichodermin C-15 hydroxylase (Cytochrome P-450 monooxygenase CYP65A1) n=1 Tax=Ramularia collo-cygni TaxID=112498 RepID=A0A2D3V8Y7_9PEZI|nr:related to isotrichodermin C-15 hydroxylase (cytochrome P-450 monooxygenase CYP65A1) [Ramularia collo-cygni]CZT23390.1 related to isotrichodermin C-15 hydroxylase (cytochrome P-450 monooxygenase CYP65A1) [Ramularia collo-cygni]
MAALPTPLLLLLATVIESAATVALIPQYLPEHPLLWVFVRAIGLNVALYAFYRITIYPRLLSPLRHLPGPSGGKILLGHGLTTFERPSGTSSLKWMKEIPNDGLLHFRGFFNSPRLIITNPKILGELLVTKAYDFEKPKPARDFLRKIIGDGLIIVEGDDHKFLRKNMMPVFSYRHIKNLYPIFWQKSVQLLDGMQQEIAEKEQEAGEGKAVVEVNHWATTVTMDIIGLAAMGKDFASMKNSDDPLVQVYEELLEPTFEKQLFFLLNMLFPQKLIGSLPWKVNERQKVILDTLNKVTSGLVQDKKQSIKTESDSHKDILSNCLKSETFSDPQLVDQLLTFLAAGHETTSSALTWTTYLLAIHPEIQKSLRAEIRQAIPSPTSPSSEEGADPTFDLAATLESLPLLNAVCNEALRLYPTVPLTIRESVNPTTLGTQSIPIGTQIILPIHAMNRLPAFWGPDSELFTPERWIDTDEKTGERRPNNSGGAPSNYVNLTFLHGPRSCIGQGFAKAELRCLVAAVVGRFVMEMADPHEVVVASGVITTKPKNGMRLRMKGVGGW